nr:MAG TPA: SCNM1 Zinc-finger of sodium channel modifier 1 [Crassvirales sp.]
MHNIKHKHNGVCELCSHSPLLNSPYFVCFRKKHNIICCATELLV